MILGQRIAQLCNEKGLSKYRLSKLSGVSTGALSDIITGKRDPSSATIDKICAGLGITMAEFFSEVDTNDEDFEGSLDGRAADPQRDELHRLVDSLPADKIEQAIRVIKAL